jgi:hypothetical protein
MRKFILLIALLLGIMPVLKHGKLSLSTVTSAYADDFGNEVTDSGDPCDPNSVAYDLDICLGGDDADSGNPCDPTSIAYSPSVCAGQGDQCDETSPSYNPSACEGATCAPGSPDYDEAECTAQDCDESSAGYDFTLCELGNCDPSSPNYDDTECEVSTCNPDSPNYDETECADQDCDESSAGYDYYLCELGNCDPSSPNYDDTECEVSTCDPDSPNYDETQCALQDCDINSAGYDDKLCDQGTCDKTSPNYEPSACPPCPGDPAFNPKIAPTGKGKEGGRYGYTRLNGTKFHDGVDIQEEPGTDVYSAYNGTIVDHRSTFGPGDYKKDSYGNYVAIQTTLPNGQTIILKYNHLDHVSPMINGQTITAGDKFGESGTTGNAASPGVVPHVHIQARIVSPSGSQTRTDPEAYLATKFDSKGESTGDPCNHSN